MSGFATRLGALVRKETRQMLRDRSNLAVGLLLPVILILLFGYGLSFDVTDARIAVVVEDRAGAARDLVGALEGTPYLAPTYPASMQEAETAMRAGRTDAILRVPDGFGAAFHDGSARLQLILRGTESTMAMSIESFVSGALATLLQQQRARAGDRAAGGGVTVV